jgi:hypothetical protein
VAFCCSFITKHRPGSMGKNLPQEILAPGIGWDELRSSGKAMGMCGFRLCLIRGAVGHVRESSVLYVLGLREFGWHRSRV